MKYRLILTTLLVVLSLSSCPMGTSFSDLEGINLLSTDEQAFTGWVIDYSKTVSYDYLTFENSAEAGPAGAPSVHRMEIVNLVPNGDFFDGSTLADWVPTGAAPSISGGRLIYNIATGDSIVYNIGTEIFDSLISDGIYNIRFNFISNTTGSSGFQYSSPVTAWPLSVTNTSLIYQFPEDFSSDADNSFTPHLTTNEFQIGTGETMSGSLDNFRIARTDIESCIFINIPVTSVDRPDLVSGTYRFTVYVKNDPGATTTPVQNRMPASSVCLGIYSSENASVSSKNEVSYGASSAWLDWTPYSVTGHIQIDEGAETALRLRISPTDTLRGSYGRDVGSLLISAPSLEYSSTGRF